MTKPKILTVSSKIGTELVNIGSNHVTGFSVVSFNQAREYVDPLSKFYYILVVMKGQIKLSCKFYQHKVVPEGNMAFVPKNTEFHFTAEPDSVILFFAFTTTIIRTKYQVLEYFCKNTQKINYTINILPVRPEMMQVADLIRNQIMSRKIKEGGICDTWNTLFFHTMQTYYKKDDIIGFMRPIITAVLDFHAFIENNYRCSGGNVKTLIALSGIPYARFHKLFQKTYGMSAKTWLDMKARKTIEAMAATPMIKVADMARMFKMSTQQFSTLCRRLFGCTPTELITRLSEKKANAEVEPDAASF